MKAVNWAAELVSLIRIRSGTGSPGTTNGKKGLDRHCRLEAGGLTVRATVTETIWLFPKFL